MSTQSPTAVRVYLARVRSALTDLPASEVEEILEDVRPHMAEIAGELGEDVGVDVLIERLGTPEAYAAELRAAGGYPPASASPAEPVKQRRMAARFALWGLLFSVLGAGIIGFGVAEVLGADALALLLLFLPPVLLSAWYVFRRGAASVAALPEVRTVRSLFTGEAGENRVFGYLRSLQPAWALACAVLCVGLGLLLFLRRGHSGLLGLVFLAAVAALVLWSAPRLKQDKRWLWLHLPIGAFVLGIVLGLVSNVSYAFGPDRFGGRVSYPPNTEIGGVPVLYYGTSNVDNLYMFDAQGKPLTDVYLYDETGRPITMARYTCDQHTGTKRKVGEDNRFPRPHIEQGAVDDNGDYNGYNAYRSSCREQTDVPFSAAIPKAMQSTPASSAAPSTVPSAAPPSSTKPTR